MELEARSNAVLELLRTTHDLRDVFDGEPTARIDSDQKAHPYAALFVSPGRHDPTQERVNGGNDALWWTFQVTAAGGDMDRARRAITRTLTALVGKQLGPGTGLIRLDGDPGPIRVDRNEAPVRLYAPLLFTVHVPTT